MDFTESPEQDMLRAAVRDVGAGFGHEYFAELSRRDGRTDALWNTVAELGFLGVNLPEEHGGGGGGMSELAIVCEELAAQGCPLLLILVSPAICGELIKHFGTTAQHEQFLRPMADGRKMVFAITEPDAGSNSHNIATTATRDGDVFRLNGSKTFISGVDEAEQMVVVVRTGTDAQTGRAELSLLIVDTDAPGLERTLIPMEISAPEKQYTLFFDNVEVPTDRLLGDEGEGLRQVFVGLNPERIMSASICTGIGRYALDRASGYAREPPGMGDSDRAPSGNRASARDGQDRDRARPADDCQGRMDARPLRQPRRGGRSREHGQVRRGRSRAPRARRRDSDPRGQRARERVRPRGPLGDVAPAPHRARQPGDGAELRGSAVARAPEVLLILFVRHSTTAIAASTAISGSATTRSRCLP